MKRWVRYTSHISKDILRTATGLLSVHAGDNI